MVGILGKVVRVGDIGVAVEDRVDVIVEHHNEEVYE
jgi:hypothetical protein